MFAIGITPVVSRDKRSGRVLDEGDEDEQESLVVEEMYDGIRRGKILKLYLSLL
jgi:hypothetical protein